MNQDSNPTCEVEDHQDQLALFNCTEDQAEMIVQDIREALGSTQSGDIPDHFWTTVDWEDVVIRGKTIAAQGEVEGDSKPFNPLVDTPSPNAEYNPLLAPANPLQREIDIPWVTILAVAFAIGLVIYLKTPGASDKARASIKRFVDQCIAAIQQAKTNKTKTSK